MAIVKKVIKYDATIYADAAGLRAALDGHSGRILVLSQGERVVSVEEKPLVPKVPKPKKPKAAEVSA